MKAHVIHKEDVPVQNAEWGTLQWLVTGAAGTSKHMTLGRVTIKPGQANPMHKHPNSDEILFVVKGEIEHALPEGGTARLSAGGCIVIEEGGPHRAKNVGKSDAVLVVVFNTPERKAENVGTGGKEA